MTNIAEVSAVRRKLVQLRYTPLPLFGKVPAMKKWHEVANVSRDWIAMWAKTWPDATNTGILTKYTPTLDLDIVNEAAARAAEDAIRERYEERGVILVRIGKVPKRAIFFRTIDPFDKITINLIAPNSAGEKIEFLANGQQVVVAGIHPDTRQSYRWYGGEPWTIAYDELPYIHPAEAQKLVSDVVTVLTTEFGYSSGPSIGSNGRSGTPATGEEHWRQLVGNIHHGRDMHESIRNLASMLVASGMNSGAAVHLLAALVEQADIPHDARWEARYRDVPRAIDSAQAKYSKR